MSNRKHIYAVSALVVVGAIVTYFGLTALYKLPVGASTEATTIDQMFGVYFGLIAFWFALIMVFMLYAVVVFKRKPGDTEDAAHIHGNTAVEILWTVVPLILVVALGVWGATTLKALTSEKEGEVIVRVTGQQWSWSFEYPESDNVVSGDLVLPVNQPILLKMRANDVLHSFWVPEFRVKQDLVPGRDTELRITPTDIGDYTLRCAEICGLSHTDMLAKVRVVSQSDFDAWVKENSLPAMSEMSTEERGALWYSNQGGFACSGCHTVDGSAGAGPTWLGLYGRQEALEDGSTITADDAYIRNSILHPADQIVAGFPNVMPPIYEDQFAAKEAEILAEENLTVDIIEDIIAYIKTLQE